MWLRSTIIGQSIEPLSANAQGIFSTRSWNGAYSIPSKRVCRSVEQQHAIYIMEAEEILEGKYFLLYLYSAGYFKRTRTYVPITKAWPPLSSSQVTMLTDQTLFKHRKASDTKSSSTNYTYDTSCSPTPATSHPNAP